MLIGTSTPTAGLQQWAGCTAIASLVWGDRLYVANAGDCRAVLCRGGATLPVSRDHTADLDSERQRVLDAGGTAARLGGSWRIGTVGLQVTRWASSVIGMVSCTMSSFS